MMRLALLVALCIVHLSAFALSGPPLPNDYSPQRCRELKAKLAEQSNPLVPKGLDADLASARGRGLYEDYSCDALDTAWRWSLLQKATLDASNELRRAAVNLTEPVAAENVRSALQSLADSAARVDADSNNAIGATDGRIQFLDWSKKLFAEHGWSVPSSMRAVFAELGEKVGKEYLAPEELQGVVSVGLDRANGLVMLANDAAGNAFHVAQAGSIERDQAARENAKQEVAVAAQSYTAQVQKRAHRFPGFLNVLLGAAGLAGISVFLARGYLTNGRRRLIAFVAGTTGLFVATMLVGLLQIVSGIPTWLGFAFLLAAFALLYVPFRDKLNARFIGGSTLATHGSAAWATLRDAINASRLFNRGMVSADSYGFALGRFPGAPDNLDPRLRYMGHVLTCARNGSGKGVGVVIPALLEYPGSAVVLDIKGENYAVTARARRAMGHAVFLVDPFGVTGDVPFAFNPLDRLDLSDPDLVSKASNLVEMIVVADGAQDGNSAHFNESAKDLIRGLLVYVCSLSDPTRRTLGEVRRILTLPMSTQDGRESFVGHLSDMSADPSLAFGVPARSANSFLAKATTPEGSGVLSTAQRHTSFLDDPRIAAALARSDFGFDELKVKAMTVYVVMPPATLAAQSRFMRILVDAAYAAITATPGAPQYNVLFLLDEFSQLGRMEAIEKAISLVRGYGARFWIVIQGLDQLKGVYPRWQTFLSNAANQFFGVGDNETAKYVSDMLGQTTIEFRTVGDSSSSSLQGGGSSGTSTSQQLTGRSLLTPDEVIRTKGTIVVIPGERPYQLNLMSYLRDPEYADLFDPNPFHR